MARPRTGSSRAPGGPGEAPAQQTYEGTQSGYGTTRATSVGYNPRNPRAYMASQAKYAYAQQKADRSDTE